MDIIASVLAYMGCVTGIIGALVLSFAIFLSTPDQPTGINYPVAMAANQSVARATTPHATSKLEHRPPLVATDVQSTPAPQTMAQTMATASARQKVQTSRAQYLRRMVQEERARRWAYQQDPDFEARFLGYAD